MPDDLQDELKRPRLAEQCQTGMAATTQVRDAAVAARRQLLEAGWGIDHRACVAMDETANFYAQAWEGFRRQWLKYTDAPAAAGSPETGEQ